MKKRVMLGTEAGKTNFNFTGNRQPVHQMPIPLRKMVRNWCSLNNVFMSEDGTYLTWVDNIHGKEQIIKLYLNYHKTQQGKEYVIASNARIQRSINVTNLMAVEHQIQNLSFSDEIMEMFNANVLELGCKIKKKH